MNITKTFCSEEKCKEFATPPGERYREEFVGKLDKDTGDVVLVSVGKTDLWDLINSHEGETDINNLIQRATNGDMTAFSSAVFGDFTNLPNSYAEALNMVIEAEREFNHLPIEIKDKFDNDWYKYIALAGTEEWYKKFEKEVNKSDEKEVVNNEQKQ